MSNQSGEWIVSYHSTSIQNVKDYDLSKGRLFAYGKGVFSLSRRQRQKPVPKSNLECKRYKMACINRVNPDSERLKRYGLLIRKHDSYVLAI